MEELQQKKNKIINLLNEIKNLEDDKKKITSGYKDTIKQKKNEIKDLLEEIKEIEQNNE